MYNHTLPNYKCPICLAIKGIENSDTMIRQNDIVYKDGLIIAFIGSKFTSKNPGHVLISPIKHYENFYDLPKSIGYRIIDLAKYLSAALKKVRRCGGITILQCNEPVGDQHAFHYHLHVFPRFENDNLLDNLTKTYVSLPGDRVQYSEELKRYIKKHSPKLSL